MTLPVDELDRLIAVKAEFPEYEVKLKDLFRVRELLPDAMHKPYSHPIRVTAVVPDDEPE